MKQKFLSVAIVAATLFTGFAFTACDDDDDDDIRYDVNSVLSIENVVESRDFIQSGTFAGANNSVILPGQSATFKFHAAKGHRLMFASMYGYSNDMFFAPENPGIELFDKDGKALTGDMSSTVHLWDNGTRINVQPGPNTDHPGAAENGNVTKIEQQDAQGNLYRPASELMKLSLSFDVATSEFTATITNNSGGTINETPFSPGVFAVSNIMDDKLVNDKPFFTAGDKSAPQLTALAETGNNKPLGDMIEGMTGIITNLSPAIVVIYTGDVNPIYQLNQKDKGQGLKDLAQKGQPNTLKEALEGMANVRHVYIAGDKMAYPGGKMEVNYEALTTDKIAFATMFGTSNDWFYANSTEIAANYRGDVTNRTVLLDSGTGVNQYPGAGNNQANFGGTPQPEDNNITVVTNPPYPVPSVSNVVRVTIR